MQSFPLEARVTPVELSINSALSPLITLETAWWERSVLLSSDKRFLREGMNVDLSCNQKGNHESLKLILIRLECMCISPGALKRCTWTLTCSVCPTLNAYAGMQSRIKVMMWWWCGDDVAYLPPHILMMWWAHHLRPDSTVWPLHKCSVWPWLGAPKVPVYGTGYNWLMTILSKKMGSAFTLAQFIMISWQTGADKSSSPSSSPSIETFGKEWAALLRLRGSLWFFFGKQEPTSPP